MKVDKTDPQYYVWNKQMIKDFINPTDKIRGKGRSTLIAECYCELSVENPGIKIDIQDHVTMTRYPRALDHVALLLEKAAGMTNKWFDENGVGMRTHVVRNRDKHEFYIITEPKIERS